MAYMFNDFINYIICLKWWLRKFRINDNAGSIFNQQYLKFCKKILLGLLYTIICKLYI